MSFLAGVAAGAGGTVVLLVLVRLIAFVYDTKSGGGIFWTLALVGALGCSRGCAHVTPPPGPYPAVSCDLACTSFVAVCPQAKDGCVDHCSAVTDPNFAGCVSKATSCDEGSACGSGAGQ